MISQPVIGRVDSNDDVLMNPSKYQVFSAECLVIYEDERLGARARGASLSGPELASLMKIGTRVVRGKDWKWGDQVLKVQFLQNDRYHLGH